LNVLLCTKGLFADSIKFVCIAGKRLKPRIVTRQPHVEGDGAAPDEIIWLMVEELGFRQLPERFSVGYADSLAFVKNDSRF